MAVMWAVVIVLLYLAIVKVSNPAARADRVRWAPAANLPTRGVITMNLLPYGVYQTSTFKVEGEVLTHPGTEVEQPGSPNDWP